MTETFHLFPILPQEIRLQIWSIILHEPRNTPIRRKTNWKCGSDKDLLYFQPRTPPPVLTQVCSESRAEALQVYTRAFTYGLEPRYTYINFALDRLIISDWDLFVHVPFSAYERGCIRKIAFTADNCDVFHGYFFRSNSAGTLKALEELKAVSRDWNRCSTASAESIVRGQFDELRGHVDGSVYPEISCMGEQDGLHFGVDIIDEDDIF